MPTLTLTDSQEVQLKALFADALGFLVSRLPLERALVLFDGADGLAVEAAHRIDIGTFWDEAPLSVTVLRHCFDHGEPLHVHDARQDPQFRSVWSLRVSEIRSILCIPYWDPSGRVGGLLYADSRIQEGVFGREHLRLLSEFARDLEKRLTAILERHARGAPGKRPRVSSSSGRIVPPSPPVSSKRRVETAQPRSSQTAPRPGESRATSKETKSVRIRPPSMARLCVFFRSMATLVAAGVPMGRIVDLLTDSETDDAMRLVCHGLSRRLRGGSQLSDAMLVFPTVFTEFQVQLLRVGENSGMLAEMLLKLADHEERRRRQAMRLKSAATYPCLLFVACMLMLFFGLPYMLDGQFEVIRKSGVAVPLLSQTVMAVSSFLHGPGGWLALLGLIAAGFASAAALRRSTVRRVLIRRLQNRPLIGRLLRILATARFARAIALQLEAGLRLHDILPAAAAASGNPLLVERMPQANDAIREGSPLSTALQTCEFFPTGFIAVVAVGEESGRLPELADCIAKLYEDELERAYETLSSSLEPMMLLGMGIVAGIIIVATMMPMVEMLRVLQ